eukprot:7380203-Prymnesium_polylepis.1
MRKEREASWAQEKAQLAAVAGIAAERREAGEAKANLLEAALEGARAELTSMQKKLKGGRGVGVGLEAKAAKVDEYWMSELALDCKSLPPKEINSYSDWNRNVRFLAAAMEGRDLEAIAAALGRNEQISGLLQTKLFSRDVKDIISDVLNVIQDHWSARHAVFLMSE